MPTRTSKGFDLDTHELHAWRDVEESEGPMARIAAMEATSAERRGRGFVREIRSTEPSKIEENGII